MTSVIRCPATGTEPKRNGQEDRNEPKGARGAGLGVRFLPPEVTEGQDPKTEKMDKSENLDDFTEVHVYHVTGWRPSGYNHYLLEIEDAAIGPFPIDHIDESVVGRVIVTLKNPGGFGNIWIITPASWELL